MNTNDLNWVAGIAEGEGCFCVTIHNKVIVSIANCDISMLGEIKRIVGIGKIREYTEHKKHANWNPAWKWEIWKQNDTRWFTEKILPFLRSEKKRIQALKALDALKNMPTAKRRERESQLQPRILELHKQGLGTRKIAHALGFKNHQPILLLLAKWGVKTPSGKSYLKPHSERRHWT